MKPSAISLIAAEGFLAVDVVIYAAGGHWWIAAGWAVGMFAAWKLFQWGSQ